MSKDNDVNEKLDAARPLEHFQIYGPPMEVTKHGVTALFHPAVLELPEFSKEQFDQLVRSIRALGMLHPIETAMYQHERVIVSGRHRLWAYAVVQQGYGKQVKTLADLPEHYVDTYSQGPCDDLTPQQVLGRDVVRRHLSAAQKKRTIMAIEKMLRNPLHPHKKPSTRQIAKAAGVSKTTVARVMQGAKDVQNVPNGTKRTRDSEIFRLHAKAGLTQRQIAEQIGCAIGTVNKVLKRYQPEGKVLRAEKPELGEKPQRPRTQKDNVVSLPTDDAKIEQQIERSLDRIRQADLTNEQRQWVSQQLVGLAFDLLDKKGQQELIKWFNET